MDGRWAHDKSSGIGKLDRNEGGDHDGLELSLGLSLGGSCSKSNGMHADKKLECSVENIQNGRLNTLVSVGFEERDDRPKEYPLSNVQVETGHHSGFRVCKQEDAENTRLTAAQIWYEIQRSDVSPAMVASSTYCSGLQGLQGTIEKPFTHGQSSVSSMEVPLHTSSTASNCLVQSTSASASPMYQKLPDLYPPAFDGDVSNNESFHDKSLGNICKVGFTQLQFREAYELQTQKELEAQKRMAARKRRRSLIEEKQLKRARREEGKFPVRTKSFPINTVWNDCSTTVAMQHPSNYPNGEGGGLPQPGSNRWIQGWETSVMVRFADDDNDSLKASNANAEQMRRDGISTHYTLNGEKVSDLKGILGKKHAGQGVHIVQGDALDGADGEEEANVPPSKLDASFQPGDEPQSPKVLANHPAGLRFAAMTPSQSTIPTVKLKVEVTANGSCLVNGDEKRKDEPAKIASFGDGTNWRTWKGCSSESANRNNVEEHNIMTVEPGDLEATSRRSASLGLGGAPVQPALAVACNPLSYAPSPFPSFPYPSVPPPGYPLQMGFPFPYCMQFLMPPSSACGDNPYSTFSQASSPFQFPVSSAFGPYLFPVSEQGFPWYPVPHLPTWQTSVGSILESSHASSSNGAMERDCVSSNEPESKDVESQSTALSSVQGCSSLRGATKQAASLTCQPRKSSPVSCENAPRNSQAQMGHTHALSDSNEKYFEREISRENAFASNTGAYERHWDLPASSQAPAQSNACLAQSTCHDTATGKTDAKGSQSACDQGRTAITDGCSGSGGNTASLSIKENFNKTPCDLHTECFPDLPFVSTTGPGPDGKTIGGFMYIFDKAKVRIVCICHGEHLSPSEFVQHAGGTDLSNPERNILVNPFPYLGHMASATV